MTGAVWAGLAGLVCGVISGLGVGGGTLLMVYLTLLAGLDQRTAQGVNLVYFLPTAAAAIVLHGKHRYLDWGIILPAALCGCVTAALGSLLAAHLELALLRRLFGGFLMLVGAVELLRKPPNSPPAATVSEKS